MTKINYLLSLIIGGIMAVVPSLMVFFVTQSIAAFIVVLILNIITISFIGLYNYFEERTRRIFKLLSWPTVIGGYLLVELYFYFSSGVGGAGGFFLLIYGFYILSIYSPILIYAAFAGYLLRYLLKFKQDRKKALFVIALMFLLFVSSAYLFYHLWLLLNT